MDGLAEESLTVTHCTSHENGKELIKRGRYMSFVHHLMTITDRWDLDVGQGAAAIDILTEDALIEIFDFYLYHAGCNGWHALVHVCRRWRNIVFGSSSYLVLLLLCESRTPVRQSLHIWPPLPIFIAGRYYPTSGLDNVIAALEHNDRVCQVMLHDLSFSQLEEVVVTMQQPFPELTHLELRPDLDENKMPSLPDSFLGGSAPSLEELKLIGIPFPALPNLLLSAPYLQSLYLCFIPHSGFISPNTMLTCLSALSSLEELWIEFYTHRSLLCSQRATRRLRRQMRTFLPVLRCFTFTGSSKYVEDLIAWINAPLLERLVINLFHGFIFDTPQLVRLISHTPMFEVPIEAHVFFDNIAGRVILPSSKRIIGTEAVKVNIRCRKLDRRLSGLAQICNSSLPSLSTVEYLYISEDGEPPAHWQDNIENARWWDLLRPFTAVKSLYLSKVFAPHIEPALRELFCEGTTDVLPKLQNIFLEDFQPSEPAKTAIWEFVSMRHVDGHPIAVAHWDRVLRADYLVGCVSNLPVAVDSHDELLVKK
jgi:hypothetical protein